MVKEPITQDDLRRLADAVVTWGQAWRVLAGKISRHLMDPTDKLAYKNVSTRLDKVGLSDLSAIPHPPLDETLSLIFKDKRDLSAFKVLMASARFGAILKQTVDITNRIESFKPAVRDLREANGTIDELAEQVAAYGDAIGIDPQPLRLFTQDRDTLTECAVANWPAARDVIGRVRKMLGKENPPEQSPPEIRYLGGRAYRVGNHPAVVVTEREDWFLQELMGAPGGVLTMDGFAANAAVNVSDVPAIAAKLRKKYGKVFAAAIVLPGGRGRGGYRANVIDGSRQENAAGIT